MVNSGKIVVSAYGHYDNGGDQFRSHTSATPTMTGWTTPQACNQPVRRFSVFMGHVPSVWQSLLGGPHVIGGTAMNIISAAACGCNLASVDLNIVGAGGPTTFPINVLADFPYDPNDTFTMGAVDGNRCFIPSPPSPYYGAKSHVAGVGLIPGTRTAIFWGTHGLGQTVYLSGSGDPCTNFGGVSCHPYIYQYMLFDMLDYVKVRNGQLAAHLVKPYEYGQLPGPTGNCRISYPGSGCYEPINKRMFLAEQFGGIVHVWEHL
jgi:hypothetical protein